MKKLCIALCVMGMLFVTGCEEKKEEKKEDAKPTTEIEKINLNDNLYYYTDVELTDKNCGGFGFPNNVESMLDERWYSSSGDIKSVDKMELMMHEGITFDKEKEEKAKKEWDQLERPKMGVTDFEIGYTEHELYFGYWHIHLVKDEEGRELQETDQYYYLSQELNKNIETFNQKAYGIIKDNGGYRLQGTCGGPSYQMLLLDEAVCEEYSLNCGRW